MVVDCKPNEKLNELCVRASDKKNSSSSHLYEIYLIKFR